MKNNYLNLYVDDIKITNIIFNLLSKYNSNMSNQDFKNNIIEIDNIQSDDLSEYDDDLICDFYDNKLSKICKKQIDFYLKDNTMMTRGEKFCDYMRFIKGINY